MKKGVKTTFIPQHTALHFFATGSFYRDIGQDFAASISKTMVCRCIHEVADILEKKLCQSGLNSLRRKNMNP
ncbi:hypothetical protein CVS40_0915 [Lucilia cuprina]|nr:hypothetical protein CVS40_0915 [Lucilia cuprina]